MSIPRKEHGLQHSPQARSALKSLAKNLKAARMAVKMKPEELARRVGCSKQVIYHIESEDCYPSIPVFVLIHTALKLPLPEMLKGYIYRKPQPKIMEVL